VTACDLAIIPINTDSPLARGKPENKLLLFWRMGMPTLVSSTPAYSRAMDTCGLDFYCKNNDEWAEKLEKLIVDVETRKKAGQTGKQHADSFYSEKIYMEKWDRLFESVL
jgi:glycosyltransferase involved in cell wall biosynthesis